MAGKHQIWSSNNRTKQKSKRSWRRQDKKLLANQSLAANSAPKSNQPDLAAAKRGPLIHAESLSSGTQLGPLLDDAIVKGKEVTVNEFKKMIERWNNCSCEEFRALSIEIPRGDLDTEFQRFQMMPFDYFLGLDLDNQAKLVQWLRQKSPAG